jgi:hypothetical protein
MILDIIINFVSGKPCEFIVGAGIAYGPAEKCLIKQFFIGGTNIYAFRARSIGQEVLITKPKYKFFLPDQSGDLKLEFTEYRAQIYGL